MKSFPRDTGGHKGIFIDIFPLYNVPDPPTDTCLASPTRVLETPASTQIWLQHPKAARIASPRRPVARCNIAACRWPLCEAPIALADDEVSRPGKQAGGGLGGSYAFNKETLKKEWIANLIPMPFEDTSFRCFCALDEYLKHLYGNFMECPPIEQRYNKHPILELAFSGDS